MAKPDPTLKKILTCRNSGRMQQALQLAKSWVQRKPRNAVAHATLGGLCCQAGRPDQGIRHLKMAVKLDSGQLQARHDLVRAAHQSGQFNLAIKHLNFLDKRFPNKSKYISPLAMAYLAVEDFDSARVQLERVLELEPANYEAMIKLGDCYREGSEPERAIECYERAREQDSERPDAWLGLVAMHEESNRMDQAQAFLREVEAANISLPILDLLAVKICFRDKAYDQALEKINGIDFEALNNDGKRRFLNLRGLIHDKLDQPEEAWQQFVDCGAFTREVDEKSPGTGEGNWYQRLLVTRPAIISEPNDLQASDSQPSLTTPIFLAGFPRSGTTLLDQFVGGHDQIASLEEKSLLDRAIHDQIEAGTSVDQMDRERFIGHFWQSVSAFFPEGEAGSPSPSLTTPRLLDRMPINLMYLNLIQQAWPCAPMIVIHRHPMDVCLSCLMQDFKVNELTRHFFDIDSTVSFYRAVMTEFLSQRDACAPYLHEIRYEDLIADPEQHMRSLFEWLGMPWQSALLDHVSTASSRVIRTASYAQASQPIYTDARYRWHRYAEQLEPCMASLEDVIEQLGYTTSTSERAAV